MPLTLPLGCGPPSLHPIPLGARCLLPRTCWQGPRTSRNPSPFGPYERRSNQVSGTFARSCAPSTPLRSHAGPSLTRGNRLPARPGPSGTRGKRFCSRSAHTCAHGKRFCSRSAHTCAHAASVPLIHGLRDGVSPHRPRPSRACLRPCASLATVLRIVALRPRHLRSAHPDRTLQRRRTRQDRES
jgi:hypothetical protein